MQTHILLEIGKLSVVQEDYGEDLDKELCFEWKEESPAHWYSDNEISIDILK